MLYTLGRFPHSSLRAALWQRYCESQSQVTKQVLVEHVYITFLETGIRGMRFHPLPSAMDYRAASLLDSGLLGQKEWSFCSPLILWNCEDSLKNSSWWWRSYCTYMLTYIHYLGKSFIVFNFVSRESKWNWQHSSVCVCMSEYCKIGFGSFLSLTLSFHFDFLIMWMLNLVFFCVSLNVYTCILIYGLPRLLRG